MKLVFCILFTFFYLSNTQRGNFTIKDYRVAYCGCNSTKIQEECNQICFWNSTINECQEAPPNNEVENDQSSQQAQGVVHCHDFEEEKDCWLVYEDGEPCIFQNEKCIRFNCTNLFTNCLQSPFCSFGQNETDCVQCVLDSVKNISGILNIFLVIILLQYL